MNNEAKLLSKVIEDRDLGFILEQGVNEEWFADAFDKKLFRFLHNHFANYQECPSLEVINENFPTYELLPVQDSPQYFLDRLLEDRRKITIVNTVGDAIKALDKEVPEHETALRRMEMGIITLEEQGLNRSNDMEITEAARRAKKEYEFRKGNPGLLGLPTGFKTMDGRINEHGLFTPGGDVGEFILALQVYQDL